MIESSVPGLQWLWFRHTLRKNLAQTGLMVLLFVAGLTFVGWAASLAGARTIYGSPTDLLNFLTVFFLSWGYFGVSYRRYLESNKPLNKTFDNTATLIGLPMLFGAFFVAPYIYRVDFGYSAYVALAILPLGIATLGATFAEIGLATTRSKLQRLVFAAAFVALIFQPGVYRFTGKLVALINDTNSVTVLFFGIGLLGAALAAYFYFDSLVAKPIKSTSRFNQLLTHPVFSSPHNNVFWSSFTLPLIRLARDPLIHFELALILTGYFVFLSSQTLTVVGLIVLMSAMLTLFTQCLSFSCAESINSLTKRWRYLPTSPTVIISGSFLGLAVVQLVSGGVVTVLTANVLGLNSLRLLAIVAPILAAQTYIAWQQGLKGGASTRTVSFLTNLLFSGVYLFLTVRYL